MVDVLKDKLVAVLTSLQEQGMTPEQAVEHILQLFGGNSRDISQISLITPGLVAGVLRTVYLNDISARQLAMILQHLGYDRPAIAKTLREHFPELSLKEGE
ncbi:hypothetical protein [Pectobacterium sp. B1J-3]|uniref:hypothetical protein n=1 Tax=Pectobacterium sp. B1J-3 TaxID=3385371 RepID=UPI003906833C